MSYRTPAQWRPQVVDKYGESSPAVVWLDKVIAEGEGVPWKCTDHIIEFVLEELHDGRLEVD